MSIAQDIIAQHNNIYDARDALRNEIAVRRDIDMTISVDFQELLDTYADVSKQIDEADYQRISQQEWEPDYEDIMSRRGYRYE